MQALQRLRHDVSSAPQPLHVDAQQPRVTASWPSATTCRRKCRAGPAPPCSSNNSDGNLQHKQPGNNSVIKGIAPADAPGVLELTYESDKAKGEVVKSQGLHRAPLSGGVKTATAKFDLPTPPVAVRNLVELARYGHLCTMMSGMHHRRAGYPFGTLVDFAADGAGHPIFCLSPLAIHSRNLLEEPRASLVVQMPGWTGLANARVTIFGDIYQLPADMQATARDIFFAKHSNERKERWLSGNFVYFRMNRIVDIYFVGGFGTVQWIDPTEYLSSRPDEVVLHHPTKTLQLLSDMFAEELKQHVGPSLVKPGQSIDELMFISIDANGVDVRIRVGSEFNVERVNFGTKVHNDEEAVTALRNLLAAHSKAGA